VPGATGAPGGDGMTAHIHLTPAEILTIAKWAVAFAAIVIIDAKLNIWRKQ